MNAAEAKIKLEAWRDLLKAKLKGVTPGPWKVKDGNEKYIIEDGEGYDIIDEGGAGCIGEASIYGGFKEEEDAILSALSRSAVPAMLAGIEAALKIYKKLDEDSPDPSGPDIPTGKRLGAEEIIIALAQAYEPYFQEVKL